MEDRVTPRSFIVFTSVVRNLADFSFFVFLTFYYRVLWNKKVFHANLQLLLVLFPLAYVIALIPAIARDIIQWFCTLTNRQSDYVDMVIDIGMMLMSFALHCQYSASYNLLVLVLERSIATLFVARYEYMCSKTPWLSATLSFIQWVCCITVLFINYYFHGEVIDMEPLVISTGVSCVIAALVFALLPVLSQIVYKRHLEKRFGTVMRYQSIENLRSATLLRRLVLLTVAVQLLCGGIYATIRFLTRKPLEFYLLNLYYALLAVVATLLVSVVVVSHPTLEREFYRITRLDKYRRRTEKQEISSVQGSRLDIPLTDHTQFYFQSYRNSW